MFITCILHFPTVQQTIIGKSESNRETLLEKAFDFFDEIRNVVILNNTNKHQPW